MPTTRILDGGMSRELVRLGAELKQPEWSALALMNTPQIVQQVHEQFIAAGADVITTNSYAVVPFHIGQERFDAEGGALIARSGQLARKAALNSGKQVSVAGCLPPIFGSYEPQRFEPERVQDYLSIFVAGLGPYIDMWLGETLSLIAEGEAVRRAVRLTNKPLWISFTLEDGPGKGGQGPRLRSGESVTEAAQWAAASSVDALLFNCSRPEIMKDAVEAAATALQKANCQIEIGVYANAFVPDGGERAANEKLTRTREDLTGERYCKFACDWVDAGASIVGGCCGVGADHIHQLATRLRRN
jgi:S-methylmethionine-dependent homocysteine/selenocysteine methylase